MYFVPELVATIRHEQELEVTKLTDCCKNSHSKKIIFEHKHFRTTVFFIPKVAEPGKTTETAELMIHTKVKQKLQNNTERRDEICKIRVITEVCDRESGRRLDNQNCCPHLMKIHGGDVRYIQDLVLCNSLNEAHYRNGSVKVVFKIQLIVVPNFEYSCRINEDGEVEINRPNMGIP